MRFPRSFNPEYGPTEHQIQTAILNLLPIMGVYAWRNNSGRIAVGEGRSRRMILLGKAGLPDVLGVLGGSYGLYYGRLLGIEVKRPSKNPTELQKEALTELARHGAVVLVAHSINEVEELLKKLKQGGSYAFSL